MASAPSLLCFDFDGTLVSPVCRPMFHPALAEMIAELRRDGVQWVINTGRTLEHTLDGIHQYELGIVPDYLIVRERDVYHFNNGWQDFGDWNARAREEHRLFLAEHAEWFVEVQRMAEKMGGLHWLEDEHRDIGLVANSVEQMDHFMTWLLDQLPDHPRLGYQRNTIYLRFSECSYHKGSALTELCRLLKLGSDAVFAAGDNHNDLSMLDPTVAQHLACPSNSLPEVRQVVAAHGGFVAERIASHGMVDALRFFYAA